jgi:predicted amidohydrolase
MGSMAYPVAVIQATVESGDVETNRRHIVDLIGSAVARGARLVVLPEACISDIFRGAEKLAEPIPGPSTELVGRSAGDAVVALPLLEKAADGKIYSSCVFVSRDGIKGVARKAHLFRDPMGHDSFRDAELLSAGSELSIFEINELRVGVLIGFDAEFPESFRTLALRGADLIVLALNQLNPDTKFLSSMALRNRVPLLVSNRIGFRRMYPGVPEFSALTMSLVQDKDGSFLARCRGGSVILDAAGSPLAEPSQNLQRDLETLAGAPPSAIIPLAHFQQDELLNASFRIDELRVQRLTSPFIAERREDLYGTSAPTTPVAAAAPMAPVAPAPLAPAPPPEIPVAMPSPAAEAAPQPVTPKPVSKTKAAKPKAKPRAKRATKTRNAP